MRKSALKKKRLVMGKSKAPDMTAQNNAAASQAQMSREQLDWTKQIYAETAPQRADAIRRSNEVSDEALVSMRQNTALAADYDNYNKATFRPMEQSIAADAMAYDTPERREAAAAAGQADVEQAVASQRGASDRALARSGVQPGSPRSMAMQGTMDLGAAKLKAGAKNAARTQVETIGAARKMDAASLGRGLAANQATSAGLALTAGNSASANGQASGNIMAQGTSLMAQGYSGAQTGMAAAAGTYGSIANQRAKAGDNSALWGALGQVGGAMIVSDVNMKTDVSPADPEEALEAVSKTPVSNWAYKEGTKGDDGGETHTGPMAQDVQKNMGEKTAPKGKAIDLISMNGMTMAAIHGLNRKVDKLVAMAA